MRKVRVEPDAHPTMITGDSRAYETLTAAVRSSVICSSCFGTMEEDAKSQISIVPASVTAANSVEHHGLHSTELIGD